ncbi:Predicted ATPase [Bradyrhizobium erythrophlei]|nr:Predicted ATPase [Bradyrhizobium erythrophlei]
MHDLGNSPTNEVVVFGPFRLFLAERLLKKDSESLPVGGRALDLLITLVERAGEVITHKELSGWVWPGITVEDANLRVHIAALRKILGDGQDGARYIANVAGRGYCFVAPVQRQKVFSTTALAGPVKTRTLPARLQRMIGRDETIEALRSMVIAQRFVSIVGPSGMGKTTLAVAVAHVMVTDFGNAICFVDLAAVNDGALVVPAVASAVGCLAQTQDSLATLLAFLAERRILLVLDSCEHVLEAVAALTERLFHGAPFTHIVATSREPLQVQCENLYWLQPLGAPPGEAKLTSADVLAFPALQLFMERATAGGYLQNLPDEDVPVVASICRQLDGIPLAIELTASQVSKYGIRGVSGLINDRLALFWQDRRSASRHQTLWATLDWSYDLLSEHEKTVLCRLSVFVGPFTLEAAQAVASEADRHGWQVIDVIRKLVDKSLLLVSSGDDQSLYRLLDTTRAYAAVKLAGREEENAIARRHALYHAERLAAIRPGLPQDHSLSAYSRQIGDVRAALRWSFSPSGDTTVGVALGAGAALLFLNLSMLSECRHWCRKAILALDEVNRGTQRELTLQTSLAMSSMFARGYSEEVNDALERGIALAQGFRDTEQLPHLLAGLNLFRMRLGDFAGALAAAERYSVAANEFGGPREKVVGEWMQGGSHHLIGNQADAQQHYESGFERASAAGVSRGHYFGFDHELWARIGLARTFWLRGFPDRAAHFAHRGIEFARGEGHPVTLCICLIYGVQVFLWRGDEHVAAELIEGLIAVAEKHSLAPYHACGLVRFGELLVARGETAAGIEHLRRARSILAAERNYILFPTISRALAEALVREGQSEEALDLIETAVTNAERGTGTFELPDLLRAKAEVLLAVSPENWAAAERSLMASLDCARKQSALGWELRSATALFHLRADHQCSDSARHMLANIYGRFTEGFETIDLRAARALLETPA